MLLDFKARNSDLLFDSSISANVVVNMSSSGNHQESDSSTLKNYSVSPHSSDGLLPTPPGHQQYGNVNSGRDRGSGRGYGNNKPQCELCGNFGHLVHKCFHIFNVHFT